MSDETIVRPKISKRRFLDGRTLAIFALLAAVLGLTAALVLVGWQINLSDRTSASPPISPGSKNENVSVPVPTAKPTIRATPAPTINDIPSAKTPPIINTNVSNISRRSNVNTYPTPVDVCRVPDSEGSIPRAICMNGSLSFYKGSRDLTCLLKGGVRRFCY